MDSESDEGDDESVSDSGSNPILITKNKIMMKKSDVLKWNQKQWTKLLHKSHMKR